MELTENLNVQGDNVLPSPASIKAALSASDSSRKFISSSRNELKKILLGEDRRKFIVVGPCSIHNIDEGMEYAKKLKVLAEKVKDSLFLVMRVYFEKPRTTVGWKGLINDPDLDGSFKVEKGLKTARKFLLNLADLQVAAGTEALDPITPQYLGDLVTWTAIGARTSESQTHREMASGLSSPVGFKNGTDGSMEVMINALKSCAQPHYFLGINQNGKVATIATRGNSLGHCILRGGNRPNYDSVSVAMLEKLLDENGLRKNIVVDCSHANSLKDYRVQPLVLKDCLRQITANDSGLVGFMIESNLNEGNQPIGDNPRELKKGVSITDACVNWCTTEEMILDAANVLRGLLKK